MTIPVERLVKAYVKIRNKRSELKAEFEDQNKKLADKQAKLGRALLAHCKEHNVDSVKTGEGLFYRTIKQRYWTNDWEAMYEFVKKHNLLEFFEKRLNQTNVRQFLEENPELMPSGLNVDSEYTISVRKK